MKLLLAAGGEGSRILHDFYAMVQEAFLMRIYFDDTHWNWQQGWRWIFTIGKDSQQRARRWLARRLEMCLKPKCLLRQQLLSLLFPHYNRQLGCSEATVVDMSVAYKYMKIDGAASFYYLVNYMRWSHSIHFLEHLLRYSKSKERSPFQNPESSVIHSTS
jgi:hypothetical protein